MDIQHKDLAAGRWHTMTLAEQMGNIGSEVHRADVWRKKGNQDFSQKAFERGLELFDLTLADNRWAGLRRKEIARAREVFCEIIIDNKDAGSLQKYFDYFAVAARRAQK